MILIERLIVMIGDKERRLIGLQKGFIVDIGV